MLVLLACLHLHYFQQLLLLVDLLTVLLQLFLLFLDALLKLYVLVAEALHHVLVAAQLLEGFLHTQHHLGPQSLGLQVQLPHLFGLLEALLVEVDVAGHFFDALLVRNRQDLLRVEVPMQMLQLGSQFVAMVPLSLKLESFLEQRSLELSLFPPFLRVQIIDRLHQPLHFSLMLFNLLLMQFLQPGHASLNLGELALTFRTLGPLLVEFELKIGQPDGVLFVGHLASGPEGVDLVILECEDEYCLL